jgi:hypothetical protein
VDLKKTYAELCVNIRMIQKKHPRSLISICEIEISWSLITKPTDDPLAIRLAPLNCMNSVRFCPFVLLKENMYALQIVTRSHIDIRSNKIIYTKSVYNIFISKFSRAQKCFSFNKKEKKKDISVVSRHFLFLNIYSQLIIPPKLHH